MFTSDQKWFLLDFFTCFPKILLNLKIVNWRFFSRDIKNCFQASDLLLEICWFWLEWMQSDWFLLSPLNITCWVFVYTIIPFLNIFHSLCIDLHILIRYWKYIGSDQSWLEVIVSRFFTLYDLVIVLWHNSPSFLAIPLYHYVLISYWKYIDPHQFWSEVINFKTFLLSPGIRTEQQDLCHWVEKSQSNLFQ